MYLIFEIRKINIFFSGYGIGIFLFTFLRRDVSEEQGGNLDISLLLVFVHIFYTYVVGSKSFRPGIQKPRQMENAMRDI
jgi:hypothetical protein